MHQLGIDVQQIAEALVVQQHDPAGFDLTLTDEQDLWSGIRFGLELDVQTPTMGLALCEFIPFRKPRCSEMIYVRVQNTDGLF